MSKSDMFNQILRLVADETEVPPVRILSGKKDAETVDARYLLVHFLLEAGFTPAYISEKAGVSERTVSNIQTNFETRRCVQKMFRIQAENIRKLMGRC